MDPNRLTTEHRDLTKETAGCSKAFEAWLNQHLPQPNKNDPAQQAQIAMLRNLFAHVYFNQSYVDLVKAPTTRAGYDLLSHVLTPFTETQSLLWNPDTNLDSIFDIIQQGDLGKKLILSLQTNSNFDAKACASYLSRFDHP